MIVVDASVLVTALADDAADGRAARRRLTEAGDLHVPHVVDLEVVSALRDGVRRGVLIPQRADQARADLAALRVTRYPHTGLLDRIWELRENVTAYDAAYVALAEALSTTLVTADARLASAPGPRCRIERLG